MAQSPCFFSPCQFPFTSLPFPFTYLETLLGVIGSHPPWSQVTRELTSPSSAPPHSPLISNSQHPFSDFPNTPRQLRRRLVPGFQGPEQYFPRGLLWKKSQGICDWRWGLLLLSGHLPQGIEYTLQLPDGCPSERWGNLLQYL